MALKSLAEALGLDIPTSQTPSEPQKKQSAKQISKALLQSEEYLASLRRRIITDSLPAAVECKLYDYAFGKPIDKVEIKDTTERLEDLSSQELEARAQALVAMAQQLQATGDELQATKKSVGTLPTKIH